MYPQRTENTMVMSQPFGSGCLIGQNTPVYLCKSISSGNRRPTADEGRDKAIVKLASVMSQPS